MASFCRQCSQDLGNISGEEGDFIGLTTKEDEAQDLYVVVLCEDCGKIQVDAEGYCISTHCLKEHGKTHGPLAKIEGQVIGRRESKKPTGL